MTFSAATFTDEEIAAFAHARQRPGGQRRAAPTRLSVVLPSYNQVEFIERTLNSIANQHYPELELIVLDGGSTDGSQAIISGYSDIISHFESGRDGGQALALNKGFALATGDFIAWQNADDLYLPEFFWSIDEVIRGFPDADVIIANSYIIGPDDKIMWGTKYGPFDWEYLARVGWNLTSQSVFVRRDLARKGGPFSNWTVCFDFEWFLRVTAAAHAILHLKRYGGAYRMHPASKYSTIGATERDRLEKRILAELGFVIKPDRFLSEHWPLRRRWLVQRQRFHERLLYPGGSTPFARSIATLWAGILNLTGSHLVGY
jgi:glycosyltransferase involved in cell wall biosynthesis